MSGPGTPPPEPRGRAGGFAARHPVITATLVACTLVGAGLGWAYLPEGWSVARRILAGAISGAGVGLFVTVTKLFN